MENMSLKNEILHALDQDPKIDASHIGIIVENGIVTLTGRVKSLADSAHAIGVTKKVAGVKAIAQEIHVINHPLDEQSDEAILVNITQYFERDTMIPENQVQVSVRDGCVSVTGDVAWLYQKNAIEQAIRGVAGVVDYTNQVRITEPRTDSVMANMIGNEIASIDAIHSDGIHISVHGGAVTLGGLIENRKQHNAIVDKVSNVSGVNKVIDHLTWVEF